MMHYANAAHVDTEIDNGNQLLTAIYKTAPKVLKVDIE